VGELRPDFFARCQFDKALQACTGDVEFVLEGRVSRRLHPRCQPQLRQKSFPSGHSSQALYAGVFLFLFLSGKSGGLAFSAPTAASHSVDRLRGVRTSKLFRFVVASVPLLMGVWSESTLPPTAF
jgi:diacylglycerol diphosphate phosphatase/phosphatidate phosphatase